MKRTELISELTRVRAELKAIIDDLSEAHLLAPGAEGNWSVRDVLAHITAWEVDLLTNLGKVRRGAKPGNTAWNKASILRQNERWHQETKDRPLRPVDLLATVYQFLGIDTHREFADHSGRPLAVLPEGEMIRKLAG